MANATITAETRFVYETLVTDTRVYEIVARTPATIKVRQCQDGEAIKTTLVDGNPWPVVDVAQKVCDHEDNPVRTVRLRKDGTFRASSWCPLRPCVDQENPTRRVDYRY